MLMLIPVSVETCSRIIAVTPPVSHPPGTCPNMISIFQLRHVFGHGVIPLSYLILSYLDFVKVQQGGRGLLNLRLGVSFLTLAADVPAVSNRKGCFRYLRSSPASSAINLDFEVLMG